MFKTLKAEQAKLRWLKTVIKLNKILHKQTIHVTIERCCSLNTFENEKKLKSNIIMIAKVSGTVHSGPLLGQEKAISQNASV